MRALLAAVILSALALAGGAPVAHAAGRSLYSHRLASPQAICARIGTDDALRPLPPSLVDPAIAAFGYTGMSARDVEQMTVYRCMDGAALMCSWGATLACGKAETSPTLDSASNWCDGNLSTNTIPAYVTGHDTIFQWSCRDGRAVSANPAPLDARGFFQSYWAPVQ